MSHLKKKMSEAEDSDIEDLIVIALAYRHVQRGRQRRIQDSVKQKQRRQQRQRRIICPIFLARNEEGAMEILINRHLKKDENRFKQYFRFSFEMFAFVLEHIEGDITSVPTNIIPQPIEPELKLAVTMRYSVIYMKTNKE